LAAIALAVVTVCACAGFALIEVGLTMRQSHLAVAQARQDEMLIAQQASKLGVHSDEVLTQIEGEQAYVKNRLDFEATLIQETTKNAKQLIQNTDTNLNGNPRPCLKCAPVQGALPALASALNSTVALSNAGIRNLDDAGRAIADTSTNLQPSLKNFADASASLATQTPLLLADTKTSTGNIATMTANGAAASGHVEQITAHAENVAAHYDKEITGPVSKVKAVFGAVVDWGGRAAKSVLF
jgi:hypothetical protein